MQSYRGYIVPNLNNLAIEKPLITIFHFGWRKNVQELRLQESQEESTAHAGRTPRQFEVELTNDLIDACRPGDIILLACYVDAVNLRMYNDIAFHY